VNFKRGATVTTETKQHEVTPDISVSNHGTIFLFAANTQLGREWIHDHVPADASFFAGALCVEHRYAYDLAVGMCRDGLRLE
jgi:hypothetical protein